MRFVHAYHLLDASGADQTIGVDLHGRVWLMTGATDASTHGTAYAQFEPEDALRFAVELAKLARAGVRVRMRQAGYGGTDWPELA